MYNHLTNDWGDKEHEIPFDIYHPPPESSCSTRSRGG